MRISKVTLWEVQAESEPHCPQRGMDSKQMEHRLALEVLDTGETDGPPSLPGNFSVHCQRSAVTEACEALSASRGLWAKQTPVIPLQIGLLLAENEEMRAPLRG